MAITVTTLTGAASGTSSATLSLTSVTASVDDFLIVFISADNNGTNGAASLSSVSDSAGNTYVNRGITNYDPGAAGAGVTLGIFTTKVTSALSSGTITINFSPNTRYKSANGWRLQPTAGYSIQVREVGAGTTGNEGSVAPSITSGSLSTDDIIFGATAAEAIGTGGSTVGDSDTTRGTWSTRLTDGYFTGSDFEACLSRQYKQVTSAGTQTYNISYSGTNPDYAHNYIVVYESLVAPTYSLVGEEGTYTISETDAAPLYGRVFLADTQNYSVSGTAATTVYAKAIYNDGAGYTVTGATAGLTKGGAPTGYTYSVNSGTYTVTGTDANFTYTYEITADAGTYGINGAIAQLSKGRTLTGDTTSYSISGAANNFLYGRIFIAENNSYSIASVDNTFRRGYNTVGSTAAYTITGTDAVFGAKQRRFNVLAGSYAISGKKTALFKTYTTSLRPLDPRYSFWNSPDGMHNVYPEFISFAKYIRRPQNTNGNGNIIASTRSGSGLFDSYGHLRVNIVDGSTYVGMYSSTGAVNAKIINREDTDPDQLFDSLSGALRIVEATVDDYGAISPNNGAMFVVNLLD